MVAGQVGGGHRDTGRQPFEDRATRAGPWDSPAVSPTRPACADPPMQPGQAWRSRGADVAAGRSPEGERPHRYRVVRRSALHGDGLALAQGEPDAAEREGAAVGFARSDEGRSSSRTSNRRERCRSCVDRDGRRRGRHALGHDDLRGACRNRAACSSAPRSRRWALATGVVLGAGTNAAGVSKGSRADPLIGGDDHRDGRLRTSGGLCTRDGRP